MDLKKLTGQQPFRRTVLDACTHQTYIGKDGKAEP